MATIPMLTVKGKHAPDVRKTGALTVDVAPVEATESPLSPDTPALAELYASS